MWKNVLTLLISAGFCAALFMWLAPHILSGRLDTLPGYSDLVSYDPSRPGGHLRPDQNLLARSDRYGHSVRWITNSDGYRNDHEITPTPADGTLRILLYGDSFVSGMRTDQSETIGAVLEREMTRRLGSPVEVVLSGHNNPANAWYHWQTFGRHLHPHVVILGLTMGNDISSHNFGDGVIPVLTSMDEMLSLSPRRSQAGVSNAQAMIPADGFVAQAQRNSLQVWSAVLIRWLGHLVYPLANKSPPTLWPDQGRPGEARAAGVFLSLGLYYRGSIPFIESAWRDFDTLLPGFTAQVRHYDARPLLVNFPTRIEALPRDWDRLTRAIQIDPAMFDLRAPMRHVRDVCGRIDLPCLDTAAALEKAQKEGEVFQSLGDMHLSPHGQAATGVAMASYLETVLQRPAKAPPGEDWLDLYRKQVHLWQEKGEQATTPAIN